MTRTRLKFVGTSRFSRLTKSSGFTLIELMVAMTVFLVIGGAAMTLFRSHADLFSTQQGEVGLNMSLRNALAQIQTDAVQAGAGFYIGGSTDLSNTPVGVTITNNAGSFDSMYVIQASTPALLLGGAGCVVTTSGTATLAAGAGVTAATLTPGPIMFMNHQGNQMTIATLKTSTAGVAGAVNITYGATNGNGTNGAANDPFGLTWNVPLATDPDQLGDQFCPATGDYVVGLSYVNYSVNGNNQLIRATAATGVNGDVVADQIIGLKIGAATYQNVGGITSTPSYNFNSVSYAPNLIRSVRVSLIGRTTPGQFTGSAFRNAFDGGQYRIQALSLVINPRNLSMND